eukprot:366025-Chlamydomonas_euryale.AAC.12
MPGSRGLGRRLLCESPWRLGAPHVAASGQRRQRRAKLLTSNSRAEASTPSQATASLSPRGIRRQKQMQTEGGASGVLRCRNPRVAAERTSPRKPPGHPVHEAAGGSTATPGCRPLLDSASARAFAASEGRRRVPQASKIHARLSAMGRPQARRHPHGGPPSAVVAAARAASPPTQGHRRLSVLTPVT